MHPCGGFSKIRSRIANHHSTLPEQCLIIIDYYKIVQQLWNKTDYDEQNSEQNR